MTQAALAAADPACRRAIQAFGSSSRRLSRLVMPGIVSAKSSTLGVRDAQPPRWTRKVTARTMMEVGFDV
ncbi:hypothetical protein SAMN02745181_1157 [Rubritalea squalenifaciens DSM 18772]|uniref:Uncharacterized protein n=1 Tax=Rubritalea squalenifaciens DSM 18772 TaxID=1123071 RepID=A0A1M6GFH2_9BACT|nr:hypothetical protein SAMN02745181_1157 [Rubritalea squalenifaciens DSM 18772]